MRSYFEKINDTARPLSRIVFNEIIDREDVSRICDSVAEGNKEAKRFLPSFTWQSFFKDGARRSNKNARPTGLFIMDFDHVDDPTAIMKEKIMACAPIWQNVVLAHITPSGHGLRLVLKNFPPFTTISENQKYVAAKLGMEYDEATHDFARLSFAVPRRNILFVSDELFSENITIYLRNEENDNENPDQTHLVFDGSDAENPDGLPQQCAEVDNQQQAVHTGVGSKGVANPDEETFKGIPYKLIVESLVARTGGEPQEGERNTRLYALCRKLRYICDFDAARLFKVVPRWGLSEQEVRNVCESSVKGGRGSKVPYDLYKIIEALGGASLISEDDVEDKDDEVKLPPLPPIFNEFVNLAPDDFKVPTCVSLLPVLGTLMSKLRATYLDGNEHAPNFMTVIEAPQASGKSFTRNLVNTCLASIIEQDNVERAKEKLYQEACKRSKNEKKQPEEPTTIIRVIPASISIAKLLKRLDLSQGLHLFSYVEELDTLTKTNRAGAWSQKSDIYRNAYDNAIYGQDYISENTYSANLPVFYNMLMLGTPKAIGRFFNDPEDGLVSRVIFSVLPSQFGATLPKFKKMNNLRLKKIVALCNQLNEELGYTISGNVCPEVHVSLPFLNKAFEKWNEKKRMESIMEANYAKDIFRRRAAVTGFRAGMIAFYLYGQKKSAEFRNKVNEFALFLADYVLDSLCAKFGNQMEDTESNINGKEKATDSIFIKLPNSFMSFDLARELALAGLKSRPRNLICIWKQNGLIKKQGKFYVKV